MERIPKGDAEKEFISCLYHWQQKRVHLLGILTLSSAALTASLATVTVVMAPVRRLVFDTGLLFLSILAVIICLPIWIYFRRQLQKIHLDYVSPSVSVIMGRFAKCKFHSRGEKNKLLDLKVGDLRLSVPHNFFLRIPDKGEGKFVFFTHTRLCWSLDDHTVWRKGDYKFW